MASTHSGRLPTRVITTSPRPTPRAAKRAGRSRALVRDLTHAPDAPFAIAAERDEGASVGRGRVDDIPGEVHGR